MKTPRLSRRRRGSSFIEILVALALLAILMVGILQMYSLSLLTNFGSAARTDLLYKAQQVVENLRLVYALEKLGDSTARTSAGVPSPIAATTAPIYLPYYIGDSGIGMGSSASAAQKWAYWGPSGANIVEQERLPYRFSYTVEDRDQFFWLVTVTATPVDNPNLSGTLPVPGTNDRRFLGPGSKYKIVTYSAQIEK